LESSKIPNGGWHFSWVGTGGGDSFVNKIESWAHQEYNTPEYKNTAVIESTMRMGKDVFNRNLYNYKFVEIDESFPRYLFENQSKFAHLISREPKSGKVYDCFMFYNELDLLETRLKELDSVVDVFVIAESIQTHQGGKKELFFEKNKKRFEKYLSKIRHVVIGELKGNTPFEKENYHRNSLMQGLIGCSENDVVILSDIDEIPRARAIRDYCPSQGLRYLDMDLFYYKLNYKIEQRWDLACIFPFSMLNGRVLQSFRNKEVEHNGVIKNAGWHFSYAGNVDFIKNKIQSFYHAEFNNPQYTSDENIQKAIAEKRDLYGRDVKMTSVDIDETFPECVRNNIDAYRMMGLV
jgi:beta-1,4-mannosyl-glycoprotein beta-1,4-N-acetylglucosaminyltransferase